MCRAVTPIYYIIIMIMSLLMLLHPPFLLLYCFSLFPSLPILLPFLLCPGFLFLLGLLLLLLLSLPLPPPAFPWLHSLLFLPLSLFLSLVGKFISQNIMPMFSAFLRHIGLVCHCFNINFLDFRNHVLQHSPSLLLDLTKDFQGGDSSLFWSWFVSMSPHPSSLPSSSSFCIPFPPPASGLSSSSSLASPFPTVPSSSGFLSGLGSVISDPPSFLSCVTVSGSGSGFAVPGVASAVPVRFPPPSSSFSSYPPPSAPPPPSFFSVPAPPVQSLAPVAVSFQPTSPAFLLGPSQLHGGRSLPCPSQVDQSPFLHPQHSLPLSLSPSFGPVLPLLDSQPSQHFGHAQLAFDPDPFPFFDDESRSPPDLPDQLSPVNPACVKEFQRMMEFIYCVFPQSKVQIFSPPPTRRSLSLYLLSLRILRCSLPSLLGCKGLVLLWKTRTTVSCFTCLLRDSIPICYLLLIPFMVLLIILPWASLFL